MTNFFAVLFAQMSQLATPVNILFGVNASLSGALIALYKDCRADRAKLWDHVRRLEDRLGLGGTKP